MREEKAKLQPLFGVQQMHRHRLTADKIKVGVHTKGLQLLFYFTHVRQSL